MKKLDKTKDEYIMNLATFNAMTMFDKKWIDKFNDGDILRITGTDRTYEIRTKKVAELI